MALIRERNSIMAKSSIVKNDRGDKVAVDVTSDGGTTRERWSYKPNFGGDVRGSHQGTSTHRSDGSTSWQSKEDGARPKLGRGKF